MPFDFDDYLHTMKSCTILFDDWLLGEHCLELKWDCNNFPNKYQGVLVNNKFLVFKLMTLVCGNILYVKYFTS